MDNIPAPALGRKDEGGARTRRGRAGETARGLAAGVASANTLLLSSLAALGLVVGLFVGRLLDDVDSGTLVAAIGPRSARSTGQFRPPRSTGSVPTARYVPTPRSPTSTASTTATSEGPVTAGDERLQPSTTEAAALPVTTTSATPPPPLRRRQSISNQQFRQFVDSLGFDSVEVITPHLFHGTFTGSGQSVNVLVLHRSPTVGLRVSPGDRPPEPVGDWATVVGASAAVNGNWYNPFDGPAVSNGLAYGGTDHGYTALFGFTASGDLVAQHHREVIDAVDPRVIEGVAGHPTLVHRGEKTTDFGGDPTFTRRHPRTAIAVTESVDVLLLVTVDGRRRNALGMTGRETADLMVRLGAHDAVMLDGGGSTAMWIAGRGIVNRPADPGRAVGNQLAIFG